MPSQQNAKHEWNYNPLLVEVNHRRDGKRQRIRHRGHGKPEHHRLRRHHHHDHDFALYINSLYFDGGFGFDDDDFCYSRNGYYRPWRCGY